MSATYLTHLPNTLDFGDRGQNSLVSQNGTIAVGLAGSDRLESQGDTGVLQGGYDNDVYAPGANFTEIADGGGYDQLNLSGSFSDYSVGLIDHRHLLLNNEQTGDSTLVLDWRRQGRVESFNDSDGHHAYEGQIEHVLFASQHGYDDHGGFEALEGMKGLGNIPTDQAMDMLDVDGLSPAQFLGQLSINATLAQIDLHEVARQLDGATDDNAAIGHAFTEAAQHHLGNLGRQVWDELNYDERLAQSDFQGLDLADYIDDDDSNNDGDDNATADGDDTEDNGTTDSGDNNVDGSGDNAEDNDGDNADNGGDSTDDGGNNAEDNDGTAQTLSDLVQTVLDRPLDDAANSEWAAELADGDDLEDVADDLLDTDEYEDNFDTDDDDQAFVTQSFNHLLDRDPSQSELHYWADRLEDDDREEVLVDFVNADHQNPSEDDDYHVIDDDTAQTVSGLYQTVLDRPLENAEYSQWAYDLADGDDLEDVADDFLDFDEYKDNFDTNDDDQAFVGQSFDHLLNRAPSDSELHYWTEQLDNNDQEEVLVDFVDAAQDSTELVGVAPQTDDAAIA